MKKIYCIIEGRQEQRGIRLYNRVQRRILIEGGSADLIRATLNECLEFLAPPGSGRAAFVQAATKAWEDGDGQGLPPAWWGIFVSRPDYAREGTWPFFQS